MQPKFKRKRVNTNEDQVLEDRSNQSPKKLDFRVTVGEAGTVIKNIFQQEEEYFIEENKEKKEIEELKQIEEPTKEEPEPEEMSPQIKKQKSAVKKKAKLKRLKTQSLEENDEPKVKPTDMFFEQDEQSPQIRQHFQDSPTKVQNLQNNIQFVDSEEQKVPTFVEITEQQKKDETKVNPVVQQTKLSTITTANIHNRRKFLTSPVPKGQILQCTIKRNKSGLNVFYPQYDVYLSDQCRYLMSGKKKPGNVKNTYIISSSNNNFDTDSQQYLGRVKSNSTGTNYTIYNDGYKPGQPLPQKSQRDVIMNICYHTNIFGVKGPRKIKCYLPDPQNPPNLHGQVNLVDAYDSHRQHIVSLSNKPPKWNDLLKIHVLNFRGRVDKPSVKNFILVRDKQTEQAEQNDAMLFGRVGTDMFNMDVEYPLSPVQAFGIVLSSFDFKFACQ